MHIYIYIYVCIHIYTYLCPARVCESPQDGATRFETAPDENGVKMAIDYVVQCCIIALAYIRYIYIYMYMYVCIYIYT